jgi:hypothetical protein
MNTVTNATETVKQEQAAARFSPSNPDTSPLYGYIPWGMPPACERRSPQELNGGRRDVREVITTFEPTAEELALLHGSNHDQHPDPYDLEAWTLTEREYRAMEEASWADDYEQAVRERECEMLAREAGGWDRARLLIGHHA